MKLVLYGNPATKKNSMQIFKNKKTGRSFIAQSKIYKDYAKECLEQITEEYKKNIDYAINLQCVYYRKSKHRVDLNNLLAATCDILVDAGVLADDNCKIVASCDGSRVFYDKDNPRVEIEIEDYKSKNKDYESYIDKKPHDVCDFYSESFLTPTMLLASGRLKDEYKGISDKQILEMVDGGRICKVSKIERYKERFEVFKRLYSIEAIDQMIEKDCNIQMRKAEDRKRSLLYARRKRREKNGQVRTIGAID